MTAPTRAYDLLEQIERDHVDAYVTFAVSEQRRLNQRIALALSKPIPSEMVRRSKGMLNKPVVRIAIQEKIQSLADEQDLSPSRVIREHAAIALSTIADFMKTGNYGDLVPIPLGEIPAEKIGAVKAIRIIPTAYGNRTEVILHDKHPSLKILAELMGLVASDKPPVLEDYATQSVEQQNDTFNDAPDKEYEKMLECIH